MAAWCRILLMNGSREWVQSQSHTKVIMVSTVAAAILGTAATRDSVVIDESRSTPIRRLAATLTFNGLQWRRKAAVAISERSATRREAACQC